MFNPLEAFVNVLAQASNGVQKSVGRQTVEDHLVKERAWSPDMVDAVAEEAIQLGVVVEQDQRFFLV